MHRIALIACLFATSTAPALADPVSDGQIAFRQACSACHNVTRDGRNSMGPNLFGVVGRKVGSAPGYTYSKPLAADNTAGVTWTTDSLSTFLTAPQKAKPGTRMPVAVPDAAKRANLIAYLASLKP